MEIKGPMLDLFLLVQPFWEDGILHVNPGLQTDPEWLDKVWEAVSFCMRFKKWSLTRWCGVGPSSRCMWRSVAIGLDDHFVAVRSDKNALPTIPTDTSASHMRRGSIHSSLQLHPPLWNS